MPATVPAAAPCRLGLPGASQAALLALTVVKDGRVLDRFEGNASVPRKSARLQREQSETGPAEAGVTRTARPGRA
jgi:hypothetical protein